MESLPQEMLVEIFRRTDHETRLSLSETSRTLRKAVLDLAIPITSVFVLGGLCEEGDLLSLVHSDYDPTPHKRVIFGACRNRHWGVVNWLLNKGYNHWSSGLSAACESGNRRLVDFFLTRVDLKRRNEYVLSPIDIAMGAAARGGHSDLVDLLESLGGRGWNQVLESAAYSGNVELFDRALDEGSRYFPDAMCYACVGGQIEMVRRIYELDPFKGCIAEAFTVACEYGRREIVEFFLPHVRDLNSGLESACLGRHHDIVELLIEKGASNFNKGLEGACEGGDLQLIQLMLKSGGTCYTEAFHTAVWCDHLDAALLMLEKGAEPDWDRVLTYAVRNENQTLTKMAFNLGATDLKGAFSETCRFYMRPMMRMLIEKGATGCECGRPLEDHL